MTVGELIMLDHTSDLAHIPDWQELRYSKRFNKKWMDEQRMKGDHLADAVIDALKQRFPIKDPADMLTEVKRLAASEGGPYLEFLNHCYFIPEWADFKAMEQGCRLFATHGPMWALSILAGGVVGSAFHVNAEPVFTNTGRFIVEDGVAARLVETGAILGLVPFAGEIQPGGRHHNVVMKVRILHAAIRHWSLQKKGEDAYPVERCGLPINQEDMGYAMLIFSYLNVRGMLRMGMELSPEQVDSLHLLWRYIGYVSGVGDGWLCETIEDQKELYYAFVKHQATPGVASVAALSLLDGSIKGVPEFATRFATGTLRSLSANLGGNQFVSGLKMEERGNRFGLKMILGMAKLWNFTLKLPGGEPFLYWVGMRGLKKRYGHLGSIADNHGYGVKISDSKSVEASLTKQQKKMAAS